MDDMRLDAASNEPARQPKAVAASFEGQRNPRDGAAGLDRFVAPAVQQRKQPFWARLQLLARLTLNAGKRTANQPARLARIALSSAEILGIFGNYDEIVSVKSAMRQLQARLVG